MEFFVPHLALFREKDGQHTLLASTLTPDTGWCAGPVKQAPPPNVRIVPEALPLVLQIRRRKGPGLPVPRLMRHRVSDLDLGDDAGKTSILAFVMDGDRSLGSAGIQVQDPGQVTPAPGSEIGMQIETAEWYAWMNKMPPGPASLHVTGRVMLPHPGFDAKLVQAAPQGFNPAELILELKLEEKDGMWPQVVTPREVRYDEDPASHEYTGVLIREPDGDGVHVEVDEAH